MYGGRRDPICSVYDGRPLLLHRSTDAGLVFGGRLAANGARTYLVLEIRQGSARSMRILASTWDPKVRRGLGSHHAAARAGGLFVVAVSVASCSSMRYSSVFNPSVTVEVEHPPGVGFVVEEVVFAEDSRPRGGRSGAAEADDERCGLNLAHRAVKSGDYDRALEISIANAGSCQPDPGADITGRDVAAAHHNVGVLYLIQGDFESAMASFDRARAADPGNGPVREAILETISAQAVAAELRRVEEEAAARDQQRLVEEEGVLRNADIVAMVKDGLADQVIIEVIRTSAVEFDVTREALADLAREGLSAAVIAAMVRRAGGSDP